MFSQKSLPLSKRPTVFLAVGIVFFIAIMVLVWSALGSFDLWAKLVLSLVALIASLLLWGLGFVIETADRVAQSEEVAGLLLFLFTGIVTMTFGVVLVWSQFGSLALWAKFGLSLGALLIAAIAAFAALALAETFCRIGLLVLFPIHLFRPKWRHPDAEVRCKAVRTLTDQGLLAQVATGDEDTSVRQAAVARISSQHLLSSIAEKDTSPEVGRSAVAAIDDQTILEQIARSNKDWMVRGDAIARLKDKHIAAQIAFNDDESSVAEGFIEATNEQNILRRFALEHRLERARCWALERLKGSETATYLAKNDESVDVRRVAVEKVTDQRLLASIAQVDSSPAVRRAAVELLNDREALLRIAETESDGTTQRKALAKIRDDPKAAPIARTVLKALVSQLKQTSDRSRFEIAREIRDIATPGCEDLLGEAMLDESQYLEKHLCGARDFLVFAYSRIVKRNFRAQKYYNPSLHWQTPVDDPRDTDCGLLAAIEHWKQQKATDTEALFEAAASGDAERATSLLKAGVDPNVKDEFGATPLMWASETGQVETVRAFLDAGADVNSAANAGGTALLWAIKPGHLEVVRLLLEKGADPNVEERETGRNALMWAQESDHREIAELLEQFGASPPEEANGVASSEESLVIRQQLFAGIPLRQVSFRDSLTKQADTVSASDSESVQHYLVARYPRTVEDGAVFFSTLKGATCLLALGDYGEEVFVEASEAVRRRVAALRIKTYCYATYPIIQFVVWIHSSGFFRETLADIGDGNIMDFVSDLCAHHQWDLVLCRYSPDEERTTGGLVDPVSTTLELRPAAVAAIRTEMEKARDAYLQIPAGRHDFGEAQELFWAAEIPIGEMPGN